MLSQLLSYLTGFFNLFVSHAPLFKYFKSFLHTYVLNKSLMVEPLLPQCGTPVGNHCSRQYEEASCIMNTCQLRRTCFFKYFRNAKGGKIEKGEFVLNYSREVFFNIFFSKCLIPSSLCFFHLKLSIEFHLLFWLSILMILFF